MDTEKRISILNSASKGRLCSDKANEIKSVASESFGIKLALDSFSFEIKQLVEQIKFIEKQIVELEKQLQTLLEKFDTPIQTLPGIGPVLGAIILSEIGDITRFKDVSKLVAFTGIDPSIKHSGEFVGTHNKMSKRGSPYLRRAIFLTSQVAAFNDPVLSGYYQKKRAEGKYHYTAIGAVVRKLLYIVFAVLTRNQPYTPMA